ncbi:hypothetical protein ABZ615_33305 [Streptomyces sp. NPDC007325]|uniref:hypothetical protein n=1 Tax=Streptomyces sp. NPDC007325 TaxID=3154588 RepID=UPI0033EEEDE5
MIEISFLPDPAMDFIGAVDADSVSDQMLHYGSFNYGLKFLVDGQEFLNGKGADPLLDFMLYVADSLPRVRGGEAAVLEIFSSTHWIKITPTGTDAVITDSYGQDTARCTVTEYVAAATAFLTEALAYLSSRHPSLTDHPLLERVRSKIETTHLD